MRKKLEPELKQKVEDLIQQYSVSEIAQITGISVRSVFNIIKEKGIKRDPLTESSIRSRVRKKLIQDERRRIIFGKDQKTKLKVFTNKERYSMKYRLKRKGYIPTEQANAFTYNENTKRNLEYENISKKLGITIIPA